jgi:hypothetical protein
MVFVFDTQPLGVFLMLKTQLLLTSEAVIVEVDILVIVIVVTAVVVVVVVVFVVVVVHEQGFMNKSERKKECYCVTLKVMKF